MLECNPNIASIYIPFLNTRLFVSQFNSKCPFFFHSNKVLGFALNYYMMKTPFPFPFEGKLIVEYKLGCRCIMKWEKRARMFVYVLHHKWGIFAVFEQHNVMDMPSKLIGRLQHYIYCLAYTISHTTCTHDSIDQSVLHLTRKQCKQRISERKRHVGR